MLLRTTRRYSTLLRNNLSQAKSPYLQSHALNPVAWQEWNPETLQLAKQSDKPIFLSIGYHTCHWCHVMNRESFSNDEIADLINDNFIPIKVDREERPDVDAVYMMYLQATTGRGGWPLNVFLTPDTLDPIFGGTYWAGPDVDLHNGRLTMFTDVLRGVLDVWSLDKEKVVRSSHEMGERLTKLVEAKSAGNDIVPLSDQTVDSVVGHFKDSYDSYWGGFSEAPKFPCPNNMSFLLRYGDDDAKKMVYYTLRKIGQGGIKDQVGHGFARYSVTEDWNLPHFEKMLYDQALLLNAYVDSYSSGDVDGSKAKALYYATDIVNYLTQELQHDKGGFYSAQDADSVDQNGEHREGAFYTWTFNEFQKAVGSLGMLEADMLAMYWDVLETGNVHPDNDLNQELAFQNVLNEADDSISEVAKTFGVKPDYVKELVIKGRDLLRTYRDKNREKPATDTKLITSWNGLAVGALARAHSVCNIEGALDSAVTAVSFLKSNYYDETTGILRRINGIDGMSEDYAYLVSGLINLYESTFDYSYLEWAQKLQETQISLFWDKEHGGFYSTDAENARSLIFRPKNAFDGAEPSSNGVSTDNLMRLGAILHVDDYLNKAQKTLDCYSSDIQAQPAGYVSMMSAIMAAGTGGPGVTVVAGKDKAKIKKYVDAYHQQLKPNSCIVVLDADSSVFFNSETYKSIYDRFNDSDITIHKCSDRMCEIVNPEVI